MTVTYIPATLINGMGGPDKKSIPVRPDGNEQDPIIGYISTPYDLMVVDVNALNILERRSWVTYKNNQIWYRRIKGGERWVEESHVQLKVEQPPAPAAEHYHELTINGVVVRTSGAKQV